MKAIGIIAEYNPFHNGHAYQYHEAKVQTNASHIVVAMSGNFLQRGIPSIVDKYTRAQMALSGGASLILELPSLYATASAEYFAKAGVFSLGSTGVVDEICYGVESTNQEMLLDVLAVLLHPDSRYEEMLSSYVKEGLSYPLARQMALSKVLTNHSKEELFAFLSSPNNILGIEYEKAIALWNESHAHQLKGHPIRRIGDGYHETFIHSNYASATAIRNLIVNAPNPTDAALKKQLTDCIPSESLSVFWDFLSRFGRIEPNDFSSSLYSKLLFEKGNGYEGFADCTPSLSNRILSKLSEYCSFEQFATLLKTKDLTYTRICRVLTHILLGYTKADYNLPFPNYLRVLGFRSDAKELLSLIHKKASAPMITKVADANDFLSDSDRTLFQKDLLAADLYRGISDIKSKQSTPDEYRHPLVLL